MADSTILPGVRASLIARDGTTSPEFYRFFRALSVTAELPARVDDLTVRVVALENGHGNIGNVQGKQSIVSQGILSNGLVILQLNGDVETADPTSYYGSDDTGVKGWHYVFDAFATTTLDLSENATTHIVSFDLAALADTGVGAALVKITRDTYGRVEGTEAATAADLPVDTTGWHVLSGPSTQIALNSADSVLTSLGTMAFQNANAVAITGGSIDGATIGATTPASGAFTVVTGLADATFNGVNVGLGAGSVASNLSVGALALSSNTTGNNNVALGNNALHSNTTGTFNIGIGGLSLYNTTTASSMIAIGYLALLSYTASGNALNIAIGSLASRYLASGTGNVAIGGSAGTLQTSGLNNVYLGNLSGLTLTSANANVSGSNNTYVGANSGPGTTTQLTNATAIGYSALCTASNQVVLGNSSVTDSRVNGDWSVQNAGHGLRVAEGTNCKQGIAVLVAGVAVVSNTKVTANSRIFLTSQIDGGTVGFVRVSARIAGTSFTITSSSALDTSTIAYQIFEPA